MNHGTRPTKLDKRDFSFNKTFGAPKLTFLDELNLDAGFGCPDQDKPNDYFGIPALPYGCTEYTANEICTDEDGVRYNPGFTESKIHANAKGGIDMRTPLASVCSDGVQAKGETTDEQARSHKRAGYFRVGQNPDYFDGIRTALQINRRPVSIGTPWYLPWAVPTNGIIPELPSYDPSGLSWHCWKISGWKTINGRPYLCGKTWQGEEYGDKGWAYFSRETINAVMRVPGTAAFTVAKAEPAQIRNVGITYLFLKNLYFHQVDIEVAELQKALISLGYSIVHATTQIYGTETQAALARFQKDHSINDDGSHFGPQTRFAMNQLLNPSQTLFGTALLFARTYLGV